jgi:poly-gamma-glutamate capsule biosynthesis protein CapA/YwtB (metallophosphatase superfamily)
MTDEREDKREDKWEQEHVDAPAEGRAPGGRLILPRTSRRELLTRTGRAGLGLAAAMPLAGWLAGCSSTRSVARPTAIPSTPTATPDTRPVTIAITGDIMLARSITDRILATNDRYPFNDTADYLASFDLTVGNLECVVSTLGARIPDKQYTFEATPRGFDRLVAAGFDIVSLANNHSGDYGKDAFSDMLAKLPTYNITPLGGGANLAEAHTPVIKKVHSTTVGFLAYCEIGPNSFAATATTPGHAWLDLTMMQADIKALRPQVDFLIVFTHWGVEYQLSESGHQQAMAHLAVDAGADFVVGAHPHVIQPSETYHGKPIVYSLGNFVFDQMWGVAAVGQVLALTIQGSTLVDWKLRKAQLGGNWAPVWM